MLHTVHLLFLLHVLICNSNATNKIILQQLTDIILSSIYATGELER